MLLLLLTGPPGAGKSAVATEVHDRLGDDGVSNALIEADDLRRCYPPLAQDRLLEHVKLLARSYQEIGHDLLIITETIEGPADYRALVATIAPDQLLFVRLDAEARTLQSRIAARESPTWSGLPSLLAHAAHLSVSMRELPEVHQVVSTQGVTAEEAANQVLDALTACRH